MNERSVPWKDIGWFVFLAYALLWVPQILFVTVGTDSQALALLRGIMGPYSPLIAALIVRLIVTREGFGDAHIGVRRVPARYWVLAVLLPFFWNLSQDLTQVALSYARLDAGEVIWGLYRVPINLFGGVLVFIGEEFGWRSYLVEKLRPLGRWKAFLLSGAVWSIWHVPVLVGQGGTGAFEILPSLLIFVMMGFIFGWLYVEAKSVWPCVLMHSYNNLVSFKLFNWDVVKEPSMLQVSLIAFVPIFIVWLVLYLKGGFRGEAE